MKALFRALALLLPALPAAAGDLPTGRLIIRLKNGAETRALTLPAARVSALSGSAGITLRHRRAMSGGKQVMDLPSAVPLAQAEAIARRLMADPSVAYAEPDRRMLPALVPNDASYGSQWHYKSSATDVGAANLEGAWTMTTGSTAVVVAVVDSGITAHPDLDGQRVAGYDFIDGEPGTCSYTYCTANDGNGRDNDPSDPGDWLTAAEIAAESAFTGCAVQNSSSWHGTHVAGTVAAATNNGSGVAGVAWNVKLQPVRALGKCGGYLSDIADAITWAAGGTVPGVPANATPADVINLSLTGSGACPQAYIDALTVASNNGVVVVAAAGNDNANANNYTPANCADVISVTAVTRTGAKAFYANTGTSVDIAAPGGDTSGGASNGILSTYNTGATTPGAATTGFLQGTSMAAPHVSGVAALMRSVEPGFTPGQILSRLQSSARAFPALGCSSSSCGSGLLDGEKAVRATLVVPTITSLQAVTLGVSSIGYTWGWTGTGGPDSFKIYDDSTAALLGTATPAASSFTATGRAPNSALTVRVSAVRTVIEGDYTISPSTRTLPTAAGSPSGAAHLSSVTISWTVCPVGECAGYSIDLSTAQNMSGQLTTVKTNDRSVSALNVTGLQSGTSYYARVSSLNDLGGLNPVYIGPLLTRSNLIAPGAVALIAHGPSSMTVTWTDLGNPPGTLYDASISSLPDHSAGVQARQNLSAFPVFTGLSANTTYYPRVKTVNGPMTAGTELATRPADPAGVTLGGPTTTEVTLAWSAGANAPPPHSVFRAELASDAAFSAVVGSSETRNLQAVFSGLTPNTTYYGRTRVLPPAGSPNAYVAAALPLVTRAPPPTALSAVPPAAAGQLQVSFGANGNGPGTRYRVECSTDPGFGVAAASVTLGTTAAFTGLTPAATHYARAAALNHAGALSDWSATMTGATNPVPPAAAAATKTTASISGVAARWSANGNGPAFPDRAELHASPAFAGLVAASVTMSGAASFSGLDPNTTYYLRVKRLGAGQDSAYTDLGGLSTLALPASAPAQPFHPVSYSSAVVSWIARPAWPSSASARGYRVEFATSPSFGGVLVSSTVYGSAASTAGVTGLKANSTYYVRVGALNHESEPNWTLLGSTRTLIPIMSSATFQGSAVTLSVLPSFPEFTSIRIEVPAGAFPPGTPVTLDATVGVELPAAVSNQGTITSLGPAVAMTIDAGGLQPAANVVVRMAYDPLSLPPGTDERRLKLFRYDETARQWTLLPTAVDAAADTLTALTNHFSLFAPFIMTAGTAIEQAQVFPVPWAPGTGEGEFNAPRLTFSNLPAGAEVKLMTLAGEHLWSNRAEESGTVTWDGITRHGRRAGSGTYLAVIEKDGARLVRRVVVVR